MFLCSRLVIYLSIFCPPTFFWWSLTISFRTKKDFLYRYSPTSCSDHRLTNHFRPKHWRSDCVAAFPPLPWGHSTFLSHFSCGIWHFFLCDHLSLVLLSLLTYHLTLNVSKAGNLFSKLSLTENYLEKPTFCSNQQCLCPTTRWHRREFRFFYFAQQTVWPSISQSSIILT